MRFAALLAPSLSSACLFLPAMLAAQAPAAPARYARPSAEVRRAAETITVEYLRHGVYTIADDSMGGRDTPSRGLDLTADYVASEFAKAGLRPAGDNGSWHQRYPLFLSRTLVEDSRVEFTMTGGPTLSFSLSSSALRRFGTTPRPVSGPVAVIGGAIDTVALAGSPLANRVVVWPAEMPTGGNPAGLQPVLRALNRVGASALVLISNRTDPAGFRRAVQAQSRPTASRDSVAGPTGGLVVVEIAQEELRGQLPEAVDQLAPLRGQPAFVLLEMPEWTGTVDIRRTVERGSAPNTVGILEGTDPVLRNEYIVFSAHMDHVGDNGTGEDRIYNGADDDASGTIGIVALARAYAQPGARPKRSLIFLTVSGEEKGLWGSEYFAQHPPVPLGQMVANINMDMIGRNWPDSIVVIGKEHSDLGATLNAVNAAHRELGMVPMDDIWPNERFYFRSDHYNFARNGVPVLFFFNGVHADYHRVSDTPDKIGYDKMSRILRLGFYLGTEVANRPDRPQWNPDSYRQIVQPRTP